MKQRILYFDIAKFIGMMMIIFGHFGVPDINTFVYSFHIPLFFLISGYFYSFNENQKEFMKTKFKQLLIPYFFVMISVIVINAIRGMYTGITFVNILHQTGNYLIGYIYGSGYIDKVFAYSIEIVGPIWFCLALFWAFVILNYIIRFKQIKVILLILFIIGYFSAQYFWLPFDIQAAFTAVLFVYLGYLAKQHNVMEKSVSLGQILPLLCIWGICLGYGGRFLIVSNTAVFIVTDVIAAVCASYLVILYCKWLESTTQSAKYMAFLGRYTIVMLCFHSIDINIMPWNEYYKTPNIGADVIFIKIFITFIKFLFPIFGALLVSKYSFLRKIFCLKD